MDDESKPTIERGSFGDRGVLESGRPDGLGEVGGDQPVLPNPQAVKVRAMSRRAKANKAAAGWSITSGHVRALPGLSQRRESAF